MNRLIAYFGIIACIILGGIIGFSFSIIVIGVFMEDYFVRMMIVIALGALIGGILAVIRIRRYKEAEEQRAKHLTIVPENAFVFIKEIIRQMRYRKKVRSEVMSELVAHFEDELRDCQTDEQKNIKVSELIDSFGDPKLLGVLLRRAKKRCRPLWRTVAARSFQSLIVLILLFIVYVAWFISGKPVITIDYLAELNKIVRPTADQSQNAAPLYIKAVEILDDRPQDIIDLFLKDFEELTDEEKNKIEEWLNSKKQAFELIAQGSLKPYYWPEYESNEKKELMSVLLPHLSSYRYISYVLALRARLNAEKNNLNQAFDDIVTCYRFGRHLKGDFHLVEQLVGMSIESMSVNTLREILSRHQLDSDSLIALQSSLENLVSSDDFKVSFKTERLFILDEAQRCFTDGIGGSHLYLQRMRLFYVEEADISSGFEAIIEAVAHPVRAFRVLFTHPGKEKTIKNTERLYDYYEQLSGKSLVVLHAEKADIENEIMEVIKGNLLLEILAPDSLRIIELNHRVKTESYATITIIAAHRYKNDKDHFPDNLNELVAAGYLKDLPIDSFSDKPLIYRKTDNDFILYSVGRDFIDDGGVMGTNENGEPEMWGINGDAVFWPVQK